MSYQKEYRRSASARLLQKKGRQEEERRKGIAESRRKYKLKKKTEKRLQKLVDDPTTKFLCGISI